MCDDNAVTEVLSISGLRTQFRTERGDVKAVDGIDLSIREGETVGLVGESGSGKSVTALSTMGLVDDPGEVVAGEAILRDPDLVSTLSKRYPNPSFLDPEAGTIKLTAAPENALREIRGGSMGMIFQDPMTSLNPAHTVGEQVAESIRLHRYGGRQKDNWFNAVRDILPKVGSSEIDEAVLEDTIEILSEVGIPEPTARLNEYPHEFSGGMRQRVLIAIALACQPNLLIADEPTTALDVTIQAQILNLINGLQDERGMSVLFITHDLGVVAETCDRVAVMYAGEIMEEGPVEEIFHNPSHPYTYTLLESIPTEEKERLTPIEGNVPDLVDKPPGCSFAPRCPWEEPECTGAEIPYLQHGPDDIDHRSKCIFRSLDTDEYGDEGVAAESHTVGESLLAVEGMEKYYSRGEGWLDELFSRNERSVKAVDGVNFEVYEGETLGLVGESGCGKSTAGQALLHLDPPTDGRVVFSGTDLSDLNGEELRRLRKQMQMIFQDPLSSLDPRSTVGQTIATPLKIHDLPAPDETDDRSKRARRKDRVDELIDAVGLEQGQKDRYPHELSGGQRQRVGIARALAVDPDFIVCDEPVSSLDVSVQAQILNLMEDLQEEFGLTYLFIAHNLSVVRHISDRIAVMYLGKIMEVAETDELFANPKHPYTRALLSAIPEPDPRTDTTDRVILEGSVPSPINPPSGCNFRTRCPRVIPPKELEIEQERYRAVMSYRERVEDQNIDLEAIRAQTEEEPMPEVQAATDGGRGDGGFEAVMWERFFDSRIEGHPGEVIAESFAMLAEDEWDEAAALLREHFESICETREPVLQDNAHPAACHLYSQPDG